MPRIPKIKGTNSQRARIQQNGIGTGLLLVATDAETVEEIEFYTDRQGLLRRASNGIVLFPLWCIEGNSTYAILPQEDSRPNKLASTVLHITPPPWDVLLQLDTWRIKGSYEEEIAVMRGPDEFQESNARLMAAAPELARALLRAVNALSTLLVNLADADDDHSPENDSFYSDVVQAAHALDAAIQAGILPNNYTSDNVAGLLARIKQQDLVDSLEQQRKAGGADALP